MSIVWYNTDEVKLFRKDNIMRKHIHPAKFVPEDFRSRQVEVKQFYTQGFEDGMDKLSVQKYEHQLKKGKYEPIIVCGNSVIDGSHRLIAAHRIKLKLIKAYVCIV